jgi:hypothetical protein
MMQQTPITERLNYSSESETSANGLTPKIGILIVLGVLAVIWPILGGVTFETTVNIVIKIPAWIMLVGGFAVIVAAVFGLKYLRDVL